MLAEVVKVLVGVYWRHVQQVNMDVRDHNEAVKSALPESDWVYFATTAKECWTVTKEFVDEALIIFAHAYNKGGIRMPNVSRLEPGASGQNIRSIE